MASLPYAFGATDFSQLARVDACGVLDSRRCVIEKRQHAHETTHKTPRIPWRIRCIVGRG